MITEQLTDVVNLGIRKVIAKKEFEQMEHSNLCFALIDGEWKKSSKLVFKYPRTFNAIAAIRIKKFH